MDIVQESVPNLNYGHRPCGVVRQRLCDPNIPCLKGVLLRTPSVLDPIPNTACIWVGDARVLASSETGCGGMPVPPGESLFIPIDNPNRLWVVSTVDGQDVAWMAI